VAGVMIGQDPAATMAPAAPTRRRRRLRLVPALIFLLGAVYFLVPLMATGWFSLRAERGRLGFSAYESVMADSLFWKTFTESVVNAILTILLSLLVIVPTAYWVQLRVPRARPYVEFVTLLPFVIPAVVLVFGLIRIYAGRLTNTYGETRVLLIGAYAALSFPYMYRSVDNGLRAMNVKVLTEAAQSLGAKWRTIILRVIFPNLRVALLSGALLTFAIVIGELTVALYMAQQTFGPYMSNLVRNQPYKAAALTIISFGLTWAAMGIISFFAKRQPGQKRAAGGR
jgi:putative spermidine/putrescine transport system permease protein